MYPTIGFMYHLFNITLVLGGIDICSDGFLSKIQHGYHGIIH